MQKIYIGRTIKYPQFVDINNITSQEVELHQGTEKYRYSLHIPFKDNGSGNDLVVIMKNPSSASTTFRDNTIFKVCNVAYNHRYTGVIILNLFPIRATNASDVVNFYQNPNYNSIMQKNLQLIQSTCRNRDVVFAWGTNTIRRNRQYSTYYNNAIINITTNITSRTFYVQSCACCGNRCITQSTNQHSNLRFPLHGLRWSCDSPIFSY